jgi:endoglucanase
MSGAEHRSRRRRVPLIIGAVAAMAAGLGVLIPQVASASEGCEVDYRVKSEWPGGFIADVAVTNHDEALKGWELEWEFPSGQSVNHAWNADITADGDAVTAKNKGYNADIASGGSISFGFAGQFSEGNGIPTAFTLNGTACSVPSGEPTGSPNEELTPMETVAAMQPGFNIGNSLDAIPDETSWGNYPINQTLIQDVRDEGFNSVRIPVTWDEHQGEGPDYAIDPAYLDRVEEVVSWALAEDLYVLLDVHHDSWIWMADMKTNREEILARNDALWTAIAERFRDYPPTLLFESINEPQFYDATDEEKYTYLDELNKQFHQVVRGTGGGNEDRVLVLPTLHTSGDQTPVDELTQTFTDLDDPNVAATIHFYGYWPFAVNLAGGTHFDQVVIDGIHDAFDNVYDAFVAKGIPVIIGEYSLLGGNVEGKVERGEILKYLEYAGYYAREKNLTTMLWDCVPGYDRDALAFRDPEYWAMYQSVWTTRSATAETDQLFIERAEAITDETVKLNLNGLEFEGLRHGDTELTEGTDYTVSGDDLTIKASLLTELLGDREYGKRADLHADFSAGVPWRISLISYDTPAVANATGAADTFAIPTQFKGDQMQTMEAVYTDDGGNAGPIDWTSYKEWGVAFKPDYAADQLVLGDAFFKDVQDDRPVKLTLYFWSGATMTYYVTESGGTVTGTTG